MTRFHPLFFLAIPVARLHRAEPSSRGGGACTDKKPQEKKIEEKKKDDGRLPHTKLMPAKLIPDLCVVKYRVSTASPECQAYFDQALGYYYSYVWMEAARSFETALKYDPNCALAWWGLSKACEKWGKAAYAPPLKKAQELLPYANEREQRLIKARLQEKGLVEGIKVEDRKKEAIKTLDELLALFDDDEEAWFARSQVAEGPNSSVPFHKAQLRLNPQHPGAHHELVHHYENIRRPALGWPHAEGYVQSSPGIPHALHMQAHLAMRIGKWEKTTGSPCSRAVETGGGAAQVLMKVAPNEDHQFGASSGNADPVGLIHDGRADSRLMPDVHPQEMRKGPLTSISQPQSLVPPRPGPARLGRRPQASQRQHQGQDHDQLHAGPCLSEQGRLRTRSP